MVPETDDGALGMGRTEPAVGRTGVAMLELVELSRSLRGGAGAGLALAKAGE